MTRLARALSAAQPPNVMPSLMGTGLATSILLADQSWKVSSSIGRALVECRTIRNLSQGQIYRATGLQRSYLSRVENGYTTPSIDNLALILAAMNVTLADFFFFLASEAKLQHDRKLVADA